MFGRLLGGIATSLLFSAFESWAVAAHNTAGYEESLLSDLFTKAVFLGNGVMAIASGLIGNVLVEDLKLGPVAPFDAAIVVLLTGGVAIQLTWAENYGSKGTNMTEMLGGQFNQALQTIRSGAWLAEIAVAAVWHTACLRTSQLSYLGNGLQADTFTAQRYASHQTKQRDPRCKHLPLILQSRMLPCSMSAEADRR
jgi:hypothetical protein